MIRRRLHLPACARDAGRPVGHPVRHHPVRQRPRAARPGLQGRRRAQQRRVRRDRQPLQVEGRQLHDPERTTSHGSAQSETTRTTNGSAPSTATASARPTAWSQFADDFAAARGIEAVFLAGDFNAYSKEEPILALEDAGYALVESDDPLEESYSFDGLLRLARPRARQPGRHGHGDRCRHLGDQRQRVGGLPVQPLQLQRTRSSSTRATRSRPRTTTPRSSGSTCLTSRPRPRRRSRSSAPTTSTAGCCRTVATQQVRRRSQRRSTSCARTTRTRSSPPQVTWSVPRRSSRSSRTTSRPSTPSTRWASRCRPLGNHEFDQGYEDLVDRIMTPYDDVTTRSGPSGSTSPPTSTSRGSRRPRAETWTKTIDGVEGRLRRSGDRGPAGSRQPRRHGRRDGAPTSSTRPTTAAADLKAAGADIVRAAGPRGLARRPTALDELHRPGEPSSATSSQNTSADVDAIVSGHTHLAYNCRFTVPDWVDESRVVTRRPVVSAGQYGTNLNQLVFNFDTASDDLLEIEQELIGTAGVGYAADTEVQAIVDAARSTSPTPWATRCWVRWRVRSTARSTSRPRATTENRGGESTLGNLVAEVQRWATQLPDRRRGRHRVHEPRRAAGRHGRHRERRGA